MSSKIQLQDYSITLSEQLSELQDACDFDQYSQVIVLTDSNTNAHCLPILLEAVPQLVSASILSFEAGEKNKTIITCETLWSELFRLEADRNSLLINLGGGVVSDLGGFVAATFKRGMDFINIPTTLLAMVDATIGGKLGIDFLAYKNGVGLFGNPKAVFVYPAFLKTLPDNELLSGYAEMVKHALIDESGHFADVQQFDIAAKLPSAAMIQRSIEVKQRVVAADPFEKGMRKVLNFGHTVGHAIESYILQQGGQPLEHGVAVAYGMIAASYLSVKKLGFAEENHEAIAQYVHKLYKGCLKIDLPINNLVRIVRNDKKNSDGNINMVLLNSIGEPSFDCVCTEDEIAESISFLKQWV